MTREELIKCIYDNTEPWSCPEYTCNQSETDKAEEICRECAEKQLKAYEDEIRSHERAKCNEFFNFDAVVTIECEKAKAYERAKVVNRMKELIKVKLVDNLSLGNATKYGNENAEQQANSYATVMKYEIAECVEDLLDDLEQLKERK